MNQAPVAEARRVNRRSAIRHPVRSDIRIECRKGVMGLGPNLTQSLLDVSQTGVCLVARTALKRGDEAEVLISGCGTRQIKRTAEVAWCVTQGEKGHMTGLRFRPELSYAEMQQITRP